MRRKPGWTALAAAQRSVYLAHWDASPQWCDAIRATFEPPDGFDAAADAEESRRFLARRAPAAHSASWLERLGRRLGRR